MATFTDKANGVWDTAGQSTWNEADFPVAGDGVTVSTYDITLDSDEACATLDIDGGKVDLDTYALDLTGALQVTGELDIGASAGTGLTVVGLDFNNNSSPTFEQSSIINNGGDYECYWAGLFTTNYTGVYTQTGSGTFFNSLTTNSFYSFTNNSGVTLTADTVTNYFGWVGSYSFTNNGTIADGGNIVVIGASATGSVTIGASGDFTGSSGQIGFYVLQGATLTNSRASAFSYTGLADTNKGSGATTLLLPAWDWSNANARLRGAQTADRSRRISAGTLKCIDFKIYRYTGRLTTVDMSVNDSSVEASGDVNYNDGTGGTLSYTAGTGTFTLTNAGTQSADFDGRSVEDLIKTGAGITNVVNNFTTDSFNSTAGTLQSSSAGTAREITVGANGVCTGTTFKDIAILGKICIAYGCTRVSNTYGLEFGGGMMMACGM